MTTTRPRNHSDRPRARSSLRLRDFRQRRRRQNLSRQSRLRKCLNGNLCSPMDTAQSRKNRARRKRNRQRREARAAGRRGMAATMWREAREAGEQRAVAVPARLAVRHGGGVHSKPAIPIHFRAYPKDGTASVYVVAIHPVHEGQRNGVISLLAVGDDAKEPLRICAARLADGTTLPSEAVGKIGPLAFPPTGSINLEVELWESRKVAMEVSAHEA